MKRFFISVFALLGFALAQAQNASVEKDIIGVQVGLFGANAYNEHKLSDAWHCVHNWAYTEVSGQEQCMKRQAFC